MALGFWLAAAVVIGAAQGQPWVYKTENMGQPYGPLAWSNVAGSQCGGMRQSPINISPKDTISGAPLSQLSLYYPSYAPWVSNNGTVISLSNRLGVPFTDTISFRGRSFTLRNISFHIPAEHTINFQRFQMEIQLQHTCTDGTDPTRLVVSVLAQVGAAPNGVVTSLFDFIASSNLTVGNTRVPGPTPGYQVQGLLPSLLDYFYYQGSLTSPPCFESVEWLVLMNPIQIAQRSLDTYAAILQNTFSKQFGTGNATNYNNRPIQPINGRSIGYYGTPSFATSASTAASSTSQLNIILILTACVLGVIGLGVLVVVFLVHKSLKEQRKQYEDQTPLQPLAE